MCDNEQSVNWFFVGLSALCGFVRTAEEAASQAKGRTYPTTRASLRETGSPPTMAMMMMMMMIRETAT